MTRPAHRDGESAVSWPVQGQDRADLSGRFRSFAAVAGGLAAALGVLVLVGWATDCEPLKSVLSGLAPTNPMSALCFILSGAALWGRMRPEGSSRWGRRLVRTGAAVVVVMGLLRLVGVASEQYDAVPAGWDLEADRWLFAAKLEGPGSPFPNRMASNSALNFVLVGLAILLLETEGRRGRWPGQVLAVAVALVATLAVIGYLYRIPSFYGFSNDNPMALHSALAFLVLALGVLLARPERGLMAVVASDSAGGVLARRLLPATVLVPIVLGWLRLQGETWGLFHHEMGTSLLVIFTIGFFLLLVWWTAHLLFRSEVERRRADEALRQSEVFYHSLVESLPQNILRKDQEGRFTFVNQKFCALLGRSVAEIVGKTDFDFYPGELAEKYRADDARVIALGSAMDFVEQHVTPAGETLYVHVIKTPLVGPDGQVIGIQGIFWDVTDWKRAEGQLQSQNRRLQEMAESERQAHDTLKLTQSRLVQSEKLAGLGLLVAGVAHEINNPLSFVGNNVAVLQRDLGEVRSLLLLYQEADETLAQHHPDLSARLAAFRDQIELEYTLTNLEGLLARTREGLRRIQQIVKDLRLFARIDESELDEVSLNTGVESTVNIILGYAKTRQVHLELDLQPLPLVLCYAAKINQVIMNLIVNAIDACAEGGHVVVRTGAEDGGVVLEVQDDGQGIDPAIRERIFDPFFTTKPVGQGTGLGLSISYGIVQDHGGSIEVDSTPGRGSLFRVHLPLRPPARRPAGAEVPDGPASPRVPTPSAPSRLEEAP